MSQPELKKFYNQGFGWACNNCDQKKTTAKPIDKIRSRLLTEGEAEETQPKLSNTALAKWSDSTRQTLVCPTCKIFEHI